MTATSPPPSSATLSPSTRHPQPSARRLAAQAIQRVCRDGLALRLDEPQLTQLPPRDRHFALEIAAGTLRHLNLLDAILNHCLNRPLAANKHLTRAVLRTALYQIHFLRVPPHAAIDEAVNLIKASTDHALAGFVNAVLRAATKIDPTAVSATLTDPVTRLAVTCSHPAWLVSRWLAEVGERNTMARLTANQQPGPLTLRVNTLVTTREKLLAALGELGKAHPYAPDGVIVNDAPAIETLPGYSEGWFAVQDGAAQWPARLLDPRPDERVLDLCAAPGGKTAQLVALAHGQARICALDLRAGRLQTLRENLTRLGIDGVEIVTGDAAEPTVLEGRSFHKILADLPCSATGVIRRHPEIRWRRQPTDPERMAETQKKILEACASRLLPGGRLVYAVCSLEPEEGVNQINDFLVRHPHWQREPIPADTPDLPASARTPEGDLRFEPALHDMDGFFIACLRRGDGSDGCATRA
ncbi:MAG: 16S rRNA (cytosine(967)-C(5))-methyltransferase RsmB [Magnetococcales bacterium]|nr:16S rRNA (cytosine(967)-C(5))-methyltransferase RsmB [Magnetococcales bacterium]